MLMYSFAGITLPDSCVCRRVVDMNDFVVMMCMGGVISDGSRMATDVKATLTALLASEGGMTTSEAAAYMTTMIANKRYVQDIWS